MAVIKYQHYLQRAHERLTERQEQRALALLFDCRLVRYIVEHVPLDARCDRIAIALDHGADPPSAIVRLDGSPITCLASGMRLGWAQLVYRWVVDKLADEYFAWGRRDDRCCDDAALLRARVVRHASWREPERICSGRRRLPGRGRDEDDRRRRIRAIDDDAEVHWLR